MHQRLAPTTARCCMHERTTWYGYVPRIAQILLAVEAITRSFALSSYIGLARLPGAADASAISVRRLSSSSLHRSYARNWIEPCETSSKAPVERGHALLLHHASDGIDRASIVLASCHGRHTRRRCAVYRRRLRGRRSNIELQLQPCLDYEYGGRSSVVAVPATVAALM